VRMLMCFVWLRHASAQRYRAFWGAEKNRHMWVFASVLILYQVFASRHVHAGDLWCDAGGYAKMMCRKRRAEAGTENFEWFAWAGS
jgi:hypothetical protein